MPQYIPSPRDWVREQVELYESSGGTKGTTLICASAPNLMDRQLSPARSVIQETLSCPGTPFVLLAGAVGELERQNLRRPTRTQRMRRRRPLPARRAYPGQFPSTYRPTEAGTAV